MDACTGYVTSWNIYAYLVIILSFLAIAILYAISNYIPGSTRQKLKSVAKAELVQTFISLFIIIVLIAVTQLACNITLTNGGDPFTFSENYINNLLSGTQDSGLQLMTSLFSYGYIYTIISGIFDYGGKIISAYLAGLAGDLGIGFVSVTPDPGYGPGMYYGAVSTIMFDFFSPFVLMGVALLFVQYIALIVSHATAFTIILPIALILRALAFTGGNLKKAANATIAIALALYIVYPLTIVFNANAFNWITTPCTTATSASGNCNPSAVYLSEPTTLYSNSYFSSSVSGSLNLAGQTVNVNPGSFLSSNLFPSNQLGNLFYFMTNATAILAILIVAVSTFLFKAIFMLAIDLTISLSFAMGLSNALDSGIGGASTFWSSL